MTPAPTKRQQPALRAMYVGLAITVVATIVPFVDRARGDLMAGHVQDGYPSYTHDRVDAAVTAWVLILSVVGALGVLSWIWAIWAVRAGKGWARWAAAGMLALGTSAALTALLVEDTSGDGALAPALGWLGVLPCVAGLVAVTLLWRPSRPGPRASAP